MVVEASVNILTVFFAVVASFIFGAIWHGPLFGDYWMKLMGFTKASVKKMTLTPVMAMSLGFLTLLLVSYILAHFIFYLEVDTLGEAFGLTLWLWLGFQVPIMFGTFLWEDRPFRLFVFNAFYRYFELAIMTVVITMWS